MQNRVDGEIKLNTFEGPGDPNHGASLAPVESKAAVRFQDDEVKIEQKNILDTLKIKNERKLDIQKLSVAFQEQASEVQKNILSFLWNDVQKKNQQYKFEKEILLPITMAPERENEITVDMPKEIKDLIRTIEEFSINLKTVASNPLNSKKELDFLEQFANRFKFVSKSGKEQSPYRVMIQEFIYTTKRLIAHHASLPSLETKVHALKLPEPKKFQFVRGKKGRTSFCIVEGTKYVVKEELGRGRWSRVVLVEDEKGNQGAVKIEVPNDAGEYTKGNSFYEDAQYNQVKYEVGYFDGDIDDVSRPHCVFMKHLKGCHYEKLQLKSSTNVIKLIQAILVDLIDTNKKFLAHEDIYGDNFLILTNPDGTPLLDEEQNFKVAFIDFGYTQVIGTPFIFQYYDITPQVPPELIDLHGAEVAGNWYLTRKCPKSLGNQNEIKNETNIALTTTQHDAWGCGDLMCTLLEEYKHLFDPTVLHELETVANELKQVDPDDRISLFDALETTKAIRIKNNEILRNHYNNLIKRKEHLEEHLPDKIELWFVLNSHSLLNKQANFSESELIKLEEYFQITQSTDQRTKVKTFVAFQNMNTLLELLTNLRNPLSRMHVLSYIGRMQSILTMSPSPQDLSKIISLVPSQYYRQFLNEVSGTTLFNDFTLELIIKAIPNLNDRGEFLNRFLEHLVTMKRENSRNYIHAKFSKLGKIYHRLLFLLDLKTKSITMDPRTQALKFFGSNHPNDQVAVGLIVRRPNNAADTDLVSIDFTSLVKPNPGR